MRIRLRTPQLTSTVALVCFAILTARAEQKPKPQTQIDLKSLGAASDLFSDQSDTRYQQRSIINAFWLGNDRVAVAFSTNRRWTDDEAPVPLHVRLLIFDPAGKPLHQRDWELAAQGPASATMLQVQPGPENSILAIHAAANAQPGIIPEGDFIQVLNADTTLRQNFYIPAISAYVPSTLSDSRMVLQTFYADKHTSLTWWGGQPLKPGATLDIPRQAASIVTGPEVAANPICQDDTHCSAILVFRKNAAPWTFHTPNVDLSPLPAAFLNSDSLMVALRRNDNKPSQSIVAHADGTQKPLPEFPKSLKALSVTGIAMDGQRFSINASGESGVCGAVDFWCSQKSAALVIDAAANRILFQQEISSAGGDSALSPDGHHLAILDRNKLALYILP